MSLDVYLCDDADGSDCHLYWRNITHNLAPMGDAAGIYKELWRPGEIGIKVASQLIEPLSAAIRILHASRARWEKHNPPNGWGNYDGFVEFVVAYRDACDKYPSARVEVSA